tara:strand:+ start:308 stop:604 length:297 start_codon:yes stop_codon:yes gene_type:complete
MSHPLSTISKIRSANKKAGHYFFSFKTMEFFNSTVYEITKTTEKGSYFITSEFFVHSDGSKIKTYKVRFCHLSGIIDSVKGEEFNSYEEAKNCLDSLN